MTDATGFYILIVTGERTGDIQGYYYSYEQWNLELV